MHVCTWMSDKALRKEAVPRHETTTVSPPQPISTCHTNNTY